MTEQPSPRIFMLSQGCTANFGEGEQIAGMLRAKGYATTEKADSPADACLLNVCTVKGNGSALKAVRAARETHPGIPLLVTGCVPLDLVKDLRRLDPGISVATTQAMDSIPGLLGSVLEGRRVECLDKGNLAKVGIPRVRRHPVAGIVNVSSGCLDACAFCSTRLVKGRLQSYEPSALIEEARALVADGCQELWLASQDAACYGFDLGTNLARLVQSLLIQVPGNYRLRLGMGNPRHLLSYVDELVETCHDPRVFRFLHLPVQSGSDAVLSRMRRQHSVADYCFLVEKFRKALPDFTLSTDLIVGFPGESREDFEKTLRLVRETRPSVCHHTRFVVRPGTPAARLDQAVHPDEKRARSAELAEVFTGVALGNHQAFIGQEMDVIIDEVGKRGTWLGRNDCYSPVALKGHYAFGERLRVRVHDAEPFALLATPISQD